MKIIGLSGISGSGKTHLLSLIKKELGNRVEVISSDNYYKPIEFQKIDENGYHNFDLPEGINHLDFINDILKLKAGETLVKKVYNFNNPHAKEEFIALKPAPILIVEGLFVYHFPQLAKLLQYKIFINLQPEIALNRRLLRDERERGMTKETIQYQWHNHTIPGYNKYVMPYQNKADLVIDNHSDIQNALKNVLTALNQFNDLV